MKVGLNVNRVMNIYNNNSKVDSTSKTKKSAGDRIEISKEGREISKYVEIAENTEVTNKRVDEIKDLINKNQYKVDDNELAKSILRHMKEGDA